MNAPELNPGQAGLVCEAWRYPWSLAGAHTGQSDTSGMLALEPRQQLAVGADWQAFFCERQSGEECAELRRRTMTDRPLGSARFLSVTGRQLSRELQARPVGRPRRTADK